MSNSESEYALDPSPQMSQISLPGRVAEGYGAAGLVLTDPARVDAVIAEAQQIARSGRPVCINVHLRSTDFRKGSISM